MGVAAAPDGTICGGTAFPMRFFSFDPRKDKLVNREAYGQWNTVARQGDRFFVGGYGHGFLLEWDPARPWVDTVKDKTGLQPAVADRVRAHDQPAARPAGASRRQDAGAGRHAGLRLHRRRAAVLGSRVAHTHAAGAHGHPPAALDDEPGGAARRQAARRHHHQPRHGRRKESDGGRALSHGPGNEAGGVARGRLPRRAETTPTFAPGGMVWSSGSPTRSGSSSSMRRSAR